MSQKAHDEGSDQGGDDQGHELDTAPAGRPVPAGLRPFVAGDGRAVEAGKRGAAARAANRARSAALRRADAGRVSTALVTLTATAERGAGMGDAARAVAVDLLGRIALGEVPIRHGQDAAELLRVLVDVARLEAGQATSTAVVVHVAGAVPARLGELRRQARAALDVVEVAAGAAIANASGDGAGAGGVDQGGGDDRVAGGAGSGEDGGTLPGGAGVA